MTLNKSIYYLVSASIAITACTAPVSRFKKEEDVLSKLAAPSAEKPTTALSVIRTEYAEGELAKLCDSAIQQLNQNLDLIAAVDANSRSEVTTLLPMEKLLADFSDTTTPLTFMGYVSTNAATRDEASDCEAKIGELFVQIFARRDLYAAIKDVKGRDEAEMRLASETKKSFEKNGLNLPDEKLNQLKDLKSKLTVLESTYSKNLNEDATQIELSSEELAGVPENFLQRLKKSASGLFIVTTKSTDYVMVMENATSAMTRKKMLFAYNQRGMGVKAGEKNNKQLLEEAVLLRQEIAKLVGAKTFADYRIDGRMAQDADTVLKFLNGLKAKLAQKNQDDIQLLLQFKKSYDKNATQVDSWDILYLSNQVKKRDYGVDNEQIRNYFPKDVVVQGMFEIYSTLLGVTFREVENAKVWSEGVKLYEIHNKQDGKLIAHFYTDFIPRTGKYGHAAAFPLIAGRTLENGSYSLPAAAIVANFNPPAGGKPSLLDHEEVETLFHEFGHIMHQTLTRAPFASLSGSATAQDFVEAPSQMLENWPWDKKLLQSVSSHFQTGERLPDSLLTQMISAKKFNQGYYYTRQLMLALFDMQLHTVDGAVDVTKLYDQMYKDIIGIDPIAGGQFAANFGHLMGGYDAGYYGYLWSKVYAQDMFSIFEGTGNLLDENTGMRYRHTILEQGNMQEPLTLVEKFLGRAVDFSAFYKDLGI